MEVIYALAVGVLVASGTWLVLRPRTFQVIIGLSLLSYAVNLFILAMGRLKVDKAPIITADGATDPALSGMATEFDALKAELQKPSVDNKAVGAVLSRIGPKATAAAQSAGPNSDRVSRLGTALTNAGTKLSGGM